MKRSTASSTNHKSFSVSNSTVKSTNSPFSRYGFLSEPTKYLTSRGMEDNFLTPEEYAKVKKFVISTGITNMTFTQKEYDRLMAFTSKFSAKSLTPKARDSFKHFIDVGLDKVSAKDRAKLTDFYVAVARNSSNLHEKARPITHAPYDAKYMEFNEANFYAANAPDFFSDWSREARDRYLTQLKSHPDMRFSQFFAIDHLGYKDMLCSVALGGCKNKPSPQFIHSKMPTSRESARRVYHSIMLLDNYYKFPAVFSDALHTSELDTERSCPNLAVTFFHEVDKNTDKMCAAIIGTVVAVALAAVAVAVPYFVPGVATVLNDAWATAYGAFASVVDGATAAFGEAMASLGFTSGAAAAAGGEAVSEVGVTGEVAAAEAETLGAETAEAAQEALDAIPEAAEAAPAVAGPAGLAATAPTVEEVAETVPEAIAPAVAPEVAPAAAPVAEGSASVAEAAEEAAKMMPEAAQLAPEAASEAAPAAAPAVENVAETVPEAADPAVAAAAEEAAKGVSAEIAVPAALIPTAGSMVSGGLQLTEPGAAQAAQAAQAAPVARTLEEAAGSGGPIGGLDGTSEVASNRVGGVSPMARDIKAAAADAMREATGAGRAARAGTAADEAGTAARVGRVARAGKAVKAGKTVRAGEKKAAEVGKTARAGKEKGAEAGKGTRAGKAAKAGEKEAAKTGEEGAAGAEEEGASEAGEEEASESSKSSKSSKSSESSEAGKEGKVKIGALATETSFGWWFSFLVILFTSGIAGSVIAGIEKDSSGSLRARGLTDADQDTHWLHVIGAPEIRGVAANAANMGSSGTLTFGFPKKAAMSNRVRSLRAHEKRDEKREEQLQVKAARDTARAIGEGLRVLGLASHRLNANTRKRSTPAMTWDPVKIEGTDEYVVPIDYPFFHNDMKKNVCGGYRYPDHSREHEAACKKATAHVTRAARDTMLASLTGVDDPHKIVGNEIWRNGGPAPLAANIKARFAFFPNIKKLSGWESNRHTLSDKITKALEMNLVSKAWADQQCYINCKSHAGKKSMGGMGIFYADPDTPCLAACYRAAKHDHTTLYGFGDGKAMQAPWSLDLGDVEHFSWATYKNPPNKDYLPGSFSVSPFTDSVKDHIPILPVCRSDLAAVGPMSTKADDHFPCTCGDKYGSESEKFWEASNWSGMQLVERVVHVCRDGPLKELSKTNPAAYLINSCRYFYRVVYPPGSQQDVKNQDAWRENKRMCDLAVSYYEKHKHQSDKDLDEAICKIWWANHKGDNSGHWHHQNFHQINDDLEDRGCKKYKGKM